MTHPLLQLVREYDDENLIPDGLTIPDGLLMADILESLIMFARSKHLVITVTDDVGAKLESMRRERDLLDREIKRLEG